MNRDSRLLLDRRRRPGQVDPLREGSGEERLVRQLAASAFDVAYPSAASNTLPTSHSIDTPLSVQPEHLTPRRGRDLNDRPNRTTGIPSALKAGVPLPVVSKRLGNASLAMTADVYMHVNTEMQSDAAERGAALIAGSGA
jgi:hypothetical protein